MGLHARINPAGAWLNVGANLIDVGTACFRDRRGFHQYGLTGRGYIVEMRFDARIEASVVGLDAGAQ